MPIFKIGQYYTFILLVDKQRLILYERLFQSEFLGKNTFNKTYIAVSLFNTNINNLFMLLF